MMIETIELNNTEFATASLYLNQGQRYLSTKVGVKLDYVKF